MGPGPYVLTFEYTEGAYGVTIERLSMSSVAADGAETALGEVAVCNPVNLHERWREVRLDFPEVGRGGRPVIHADLRLPEHADEKRRLSNGRVVARSGLKIGS